MPRFFRAATTVVTLALGAALTAATFAGCGDSSSTTGVTTSIPTTLSTVSGAGQAATVGAAVTSPLVVKVVDQSGNALSGVTVTWAVASGGGSLSTTSSSTDANGQASTVYTAGTTVGTSTITATVAGLAAATFTVTVTAATATTDCSAAYELCASHGGARARRRRPRVLAVYVARVAVYLFFDESGNLDFGPKGTRYFCVGTLTTRDPAALERALGALRYELLAEGVELEAFHAAEDRQAVRDRVFAALAAVGGFDVDALVVEKAGVPAALREEVRFYPECAERLLAPVFARYPDPRERVVVVTDRLPLNRTRQAVEKAFKLFIRRRLGARPFGVLHHASAAHAGLQAADYALWAVYRRWRNGDLRSHALVAPYLRSERLADLAADD